MTSSGCLVAQVGGWWEGLRPGVFRPYFPLSVMTRWSHHFQSEFKVFNLTWFLCSRLNRLVITWVPPHTLYVWWFSVWIQTSSLTQTWKFILSNRVYIDHMKPYHEHIGLPFEPSLKLCIHCLDPLSTRRRWVIVNFIQELGGFRGPQYDLISDTTTIFP